ncbi:tRNA (cytosine(38)-C(5))-methyltransferase [Microplitis mediator]|uniref:tRNA (cytosine(38)-C(5))-methyltransferase n=1 Tax=Microplitis mediator TaxID=375433 RepID=UPI0025574B88|nr:tRNA (cytosine(38)-C(5))-methyltransferase [Microplitis mediator]
MRVLELYSGIGGMHYAFEKSGVPGTIVAAIEISTVANEVYKHNFPSTKLINRNIGSLTVKDIEDMKIDSIFMSPPCQPFTRNGLQKDINDARTISFFHILELIPQLTNLKYILLENVEPFSKSLSRDILTSCLQNSGFNYRECILSPSDFGVPNSRSRYFLIAKKKNIAFCLSDSTITDVNADLILNILSKSCRFKIFKNKHPEYLTNNCIKLSEIVSNSNDIDTHEYNLPETILNKYIKVLDIRSPDSKGSCCFTSAYGRYAEGTGSVFSPLPSSDVEEKIYQLKNNELTQNPDILKSLRLRYFTPGEVSRLMCFPHKFTFPSTINKRQRYKLIGNSINVHIVSLLIILLDYVPDSN